MSHKLWNRVYLVQGKDQDRPVWHFVLLSSKSEEFKEKFIKEVNSIDVTKWGYKIESGWGKHPSEDLKEKVPKYVDV